MLVLNIIHLEKEIEFLNWGISWNKVMGCWRKRWIIGLADIIFNTLAVQSIIQSTPTIAIVLSVPTTVAI